MTALFTAALNFILGNPTLIAIGAGIIGALGWGIKQKRAGRAEERAKQAAAEHAAKSEAERIEDAVAGRDPDENRERLSRW